MKPAPFHPDEFEQRAPQNPTVVNLILFTLDVHAQTKARRDAQDNPGGAIEVENSGHTYAIPARYALRALNAWRKGQGWRSGGDLREKAAAMLAEHRAAEQAELEAIAEESSKLDKARREKLEHHAPGRIS